MKTKEQLQILDRFVQQISGFAFRFGTELQLQDDVATALATLKIEYEREKIFGPQNRIDFYLPECCLGIECKVDGSPAEVSRQLVRYAGLDEIDALLLISSKRRHYVNRVAILGKPVGWLWVGGGQL